MIKRRMPPSAAGSDFPGRFASEIEVPGVLGVHRQEPITLLTEKDGELDKSLDDAVADDEEDDELEEENEVEAAAEANRG